MSELVMIAIEKSFPSFSGSGSTVWEPLQV